jgi:hypothetical protein
MFIGFAATAGQRTMSSAEFVAVYAELRHPHHLVPSSWDWGQIGWFALWAVVAAGLVVVSVPRSERVVAVRRWTVPVAVLGGIGGLVLVANYLLIEVYPVRLVAQLYPERYFGMFRLCLYVALAAGVAALARRGRRGRVLAVALPVGLVVWEWVRQRLFATSAPPIEDLAVPLVVACVGILAGLAVRRQARRVLAGVLVAACLAGIAFGVVPAVDQANAVRARAGVPPPYLVTGREAAGLAAAVPSDAMFLADPNNQLFDTLHLMGQRSSASSWKLVPISDTGLSQWLARLERLGLVRATGQGYAWTGRRYEDIPIEDLIAAAREFGASYLVTTARAAQRYRSSPQLEDLGQTGRFAYFHISG